MHRTVQGAPSAADFKEQADVIAAIRALSNPPKAYHIVTYGCQMNAHDSETLAGMLEAMGLTPTEHKEDADLILFNTCCIRDNAERKALGNMTWLKQLKKERPDMLLCVCGCMIQQEKMAQVILRQYPFFDIAFGTHNLFRFPTMLLEALETRRQIIEVQPDACASIVEGMPVKRESDIKAYISIIFGCDNYCSYCIVPYVRGRERSRDPGEIEREAEALLLDGVKEITLLGQNVNSYGADLPGGVSFATLLTRLNALGVPRIRFMTSHPKDLSDELIGAIASSKHVARHIHLPVQSGSDEILMKMNRRYTREAYLARVARLRQAMPEIALTTDIIVGFPGETEGDFLHTLSLVEAVRFDSAFTFIFSPREGAKAATLPDQIDPGIAADRIARLIAAQEAITEEIYQGLVGTTQSVLVEGLSRRSQDQVTGKCERNITCNFTGAPDLAGKFVPVRIESAAHNTLKGSLAE